MPSCLNCLCICRDAAKIPAKRKILVLGNCAVAFKVLSLHSGRLARAITGASLVCGISRRRALHSGRKVWAANFEPIRPGRLPRQPKPLFPVGYGNHVVPAAGRRRAFASRRNLPSSTISTFMPSASGISEIGPNCSSLGETATFLGVRGSLDRGKTEVSRREGLWRKLLNFTCHQIS